MKWLCFAVLIAGATMPLHAQGCAQCKDNMQATPPQTQRAYRHGIVLLVATASIIFVGTVVILKRNR